MFNEDEDWNDEEEAKVLSKLVLRDNQKSNSSSNVKVKQNKKKRSEIYTVFPHRLLCYMTKSVMERKQKNQY